MSEIARGRCVAPLCGRETLSVHYHLCDACEKRASEAMLAARPALLEAMVTERAEAEAWLAAEWAPKRRWVIANDDYQEEPVEAVALEMADFLGWDTRIGFVDDARSATAWRLGQDSEAARAWRAHLAPLLAAALKQALATFPLAWVGRELKAALLQADGYGEDDSGNAFEDGIWEEPGKAGLSQGAEDYLELRYYPDETWMCDASGFPDTAGSDLWLQYRVLPDDIMEILDAAWDAHDG